MFDSQRFLDEVNTQGYSIVNNALPEDFIERAKRELMKAIDQEVAYHNSNDYVDYSMVMLCSLYDKVFWDLFDLPLIHQPLETVLGEGCIVYAYTSSSMPPNKTNFSNRIHADCPRLIPDYITNLGATILLDDFTEENGATWFLPFSQSRKDTPSEEEFFGNGKRLVAGKGTVWFFNANLWHAGGNNSTNEWRHALTLNVCRPWMKQRIDIPRAMQSIDLSEMSQKARQKLGFDAQVPANYDEYYVPPSERKFKQKVE